MDIDHINEALRLQKSFIGKKNKTKHTHNSLNPLQTIVPDIVFLQVAFQTFKLLHINWWLTCIRAWLIAAMWGMRMSHGEVQTRLATLICCCSRPGTPTCRNGVWKWRRWKVADEKKWTWPSIQPPRDPRIRSNDSIVSIFITVAPLAMTVAH